MSHPDRSTRGSGATGAMGATHVPHARPTIFATMAATALVVASCAVSGSSPSPTAVATGAVSSPAVSTVVPAASSSPGAGATTTTDWGVIRDAVPAGFPLPPGSEPADLPDGPYSGTYTTSTPAPSAASAVEAGLLGGGWMQITTSGPTEAGEVTIDAIGAAAGCRVRVAVRPLGGLTAVTVLYGAACP